VVERHRDVGSELPLNVDRLLRRQQAAAAVHVTLELDALVAHLPKSFEGEHLKAPRVGDDRAIPRHERVEAAELRDYILSRPHVEMVGVRQYDARPDRPEVGGRERAHRGLCADGHEDRGRDRAARQAERAGAGGAGGRVNREFEHQVMAMASP
jgi:hypothetical protein